MEVPETERCLSDEQETELKGAIDPLEECEDLGLSLYLMAKAFVESCLL